MRNHAITFALTTMLLSAFISLAAGMPFLPALLLSSAISLLAMGLHYGNFAIRAPHAVRIHRGVGGAGVIAAHPVRRHRVYNVANRHGVPPVQHTRVFTNAHQGATTHHRRAAPVPPRPNASNGTTRRTTVRFTR